MFRWSPAYKQARSKATVGGDRDLQECASCAKIFDRGETQVDHIDPVGPQPPAVTWSVYIQRMSYFNPDNLQVLCKPCHKSKTGNDTKRMRDERRKKI